MTEVKYAHQNVGFEAIDPAAGKFLVKNRFYFTNLKKYMISYTVKANGKTIKGGKVSLDIEPQSSKELDINLNGLRLLRAGGQLLTFSCSGAIDTDLFQKIVAGAVIDARRQAWALTRFGAGVDHPLLMTFPEGEYLKGLHLKLCD